MSKNESEDVVMVDNIRILVIEFIAFEMASVIVMTIVMMIAMWRLFEKAGVAGWKALIPVYSGLKFYDVAWDSVFYGINLVISIFAAMMIPWSATRGVEALVPGLIAWVISAGITIVFNIKLARVYDTGIGFGIGLIFFNPIFLMILAFGNAKYNPDSI